VRGRLGVELQPCGDLNLDAAGVVEMAARLKQLLDRDLLRNDVVEIFEEAVLLAGVQLDGAKDVSELEAVDDDACLVGECAGRDDVHAPGGEGTGHIGEEAGAVTGDDGEVEELTLGAKVELNWVLVEIGG